ncbi:hypothetical protein AM500_06780 [Bacillus sp. FJAT-18017]|uniref:hypothetical protein n=1 Tax=Bacillus sp. FJAT-18017 TaxID=1705566 RepID=UPI0006AE41CA|nr:hypothetical protein [Bacillus sp. FJAT-18017]ALC89521.1 hypothetical protein AM500_06780 [Bacillus sp. FJAT-18017]
MNQFSKELRSAMHGSALAEARLTVNEKEQIMNRIQSLKGKKPRKKRDILPKALTAIAAAGFIFLAGGIAATELGYLEGITGSTPNPQSSGLPFYEHIEKGDILKGWELVRKTPNNGQSNLMGATFEGVAVLSGILVYQDEKAGEFANKIVFIPDAHSAKLLPTAHGDVRELVFNDIDMKTVEKIYQINPGSIAENVKIEITSYTALQHRDKDVADVINLRREVMEDDPPRTYTSRKISVDSAGTIILNTELNAIYEKYSTSYDDKLLNGLDPFSVFLLYFHADEKEDYAAQYALYNSSPDVHAPFASLEEYIKESENQNDEDVIDLLTIVKNSGMVKEELRGDGTAIIHISDFDGLAFALTKNKEGIWKVNWLPIQ